MFGLLGVLLKVVQKYVCVLLVFICEIIHIFRRCTFGFHHMFSYLFKVNARITQYREKYIYLH